MCSVIDYNDVAPTTYADLIGHVNSKIFSCTQYHKRFFRPAVSIAVQDSAGGDSGIMIKGKPGWMSTQGGQSIYHGMKVGAWKLPSHSINIHFRRTVYVMCRGLIK